MALPPRPRRKRRAQPEQHAMEQRLAWQARYEGVENARPEGFEPTELNDRTPLELGAHTVTSLLED
jgi:hypothetical protein